MPNTEQVSEIEQILVKFFNEAEADVHSDNFNNGSVITKAGTNAQKAISDLITKARLEELEHIPWKRSDKYGINTPYITKAYYIERKAELQQSLTNKEKL